MLGARGAEAGEKIKAERMRRNHYGDVGIDSRGFREWKDE